MLLHGFGAPETILVGLASMLSAPVGTRFAFPAAPLSLSSVPELGFGMMDARAWWLIDIERIQAQLPGWARQSGRNGGSAGLAAARQTGRWMAGARARRLRQTDPGVFSPGDVGDGCDAAQWAKAGRRGAVVRDDHCRAGVGQPLLSKVANLPVLQSHGVMDPLLPFEQAERLRDRLSGAGAKLDFVGVYARWPWGPDCPGPPPRFCSRCS